MEDNIIVDLFWERNDNAIKETDAKYGRYCKSIAMNILGNNEDADECVNDTYLKTWNAIPPHRPKILSTFLGKITRNLSFDRFRYNHAGKRYCGEMELILEELGECVSGSDSVVQTVEEKELIQEVNHFLDSLPRIKCSIFLCRYWYALPVSRIAERFSMSEGNVSVTLNRIRSKLKKHLLERGYDL